MWIKFEPKEDEISEGVFKIWVPQWLQKQLKPDIELQFGLRTVMVQTDVLTAEVEGIENGINNPQIIYCTKNILKYLFIPDSIVFQMANTFEHINIGPVIGLLLGEQRYYYHDKYMEEFTHTLSRYNETGGLVFAFKNTSIDWDEKCIYGLFFNPLQRVWEYGKFPYPSVIYRRAFQMTGETVEKLKDAGSQIFNSRRLNKWQAYVKLRRNPNLENFLPDTKKVKDMLSIFKFLELHHRVILKPSDLSRGRGINIIHQYDENLFYVCDYSNGDMEEFFLNNDQLKKYFETSLLWEKNYIMQPHLHLAKINDAPWDIRVVMQKERGGLWMCTGIECRVAGGKDLVTNISRGGMAVSLGEALRLTAGTQDMAAEIKKKVIFLAKEMCLTIEQDQDERFAEFGIDIALDAHHRLWIIEMNVRPTFNGFKKHMDFNQFLYISSSPILYAAAMAGF